MPPGVVGELALHEAQEDIAPFVSARASIKHSPHKIIAQRADYRRLKLHDLAWLGLMQAERRLHEDDDTEGQALCIGSEQVLILQALPSEVAAELMQTWQCAWQRNALTAPWLPSDTTWVWIEAQCKTRRKNDTQDLGEYALRAARMTWEQERETPLWRCLLRDASAIALDDLQGWHAHAQACFGALVPYLRLVKIADWLSEQSGLKLGSGDD